MSKLISNECSGGWDKMRSEHEIINQCCGSVINFASWIRVHKFYITDPAPDPYYLSKLNILSFFKINYPVTIWR